MGKFSDVRGVTIAVFSVGSASIGSLCKVDPCNGKHLLSSIEITQRISDRFYYIIMRRCVTWTNSK